MTQRLSYLAVILSLVALVVASWPRREPHGLLGATGRSVALNCVTPITCTPTETASGVQSWLVDGGTGLPSPGLLNNALLSNGSGSWVSSVVGGDIAPLGSLGNFKVDGLQTIPISAVAPTTGQVLEYNGADWIGTTLASDNYRKTYSCTGTATPSGSQLAGFPLCNVNVTPVASGDNLEIHLNVFVIMNMNQTSLDAVQTFAVGYSTGSCCTSSAGTCSIQGVGSEFQLFDPIVEASSDNGRNAAGNGSVHDVLAPGSTSTITMCPIVKNIQQLGSTTQVTASMIVVDTAL